MIRTLLLVLLCTAGDACDTDDCDTDDGVALLQLRRASAVQATRPNLRPVLLTARLVALDVAFVVTTNREGSFLPNPVPGGELPPDRGCTFLRKTPPGYPWGDSDFWERPPEFEATAGAQAVACTVSPEVDGPRAGDVCGFAQVFVVRCPVGVTADSAEVSLVRKDKGKVVTDYGTLAVARPTVPGAKVAACALLNLDKSEAHNSAAQLTDYLAWHRLAGVDHFALYGFVGDRARTFPQDSDLESAEMHRVLKGAVDQGKATYVSWPFGSPTKPQFHVDQVAQINDCLLLMQSAQWLRLSDLDEFAHPLNADMDLRATVDAADAKGWPLLVTTDVRWRRSGLELPAAIAPGPLADFDIHEPRAVTAYAKSMVKPERVAFARVHTNHDYRPTQSNGTSMIHIDQWQVNSGAPLSSGDALGVFSHHFGGGGPQVDVVESRGHTMLTRFEPCLALARAGADARACARTAQAAFLEQFRGNLTHLLVGLIAQPFSQLYERALVLGENPKMVRHS